MNKIVAWILVVVVIIIGIFWYWHYHSNENGYSVPTAATSSAPVKNLITIDTYNDATSGVAYLYPERFSTTYIRAVDWPPKVQVLNQAYSCTQAGSPTSSSGQTVEKTINGRAYCVTSEVGAAAGSVYTNYAYATEQEGKEYIFTFSIQSPQCANYDEPNQSACQSEESSFTPDTIIDTIAQSAFANLHGAS